MASIQCFRIQCLMQQSANRLPEQSVHLAHRFNYVYSVQSLF